jgi:hypothetical protein
MADKRPGPLSNAMLVFAMLVERRECLDRRRRAEAAGAVAPDPRLESINTRLRGLRRFCPDDYNRALRSINLPAEDIKELENL